MAKSIVWLNMKMNSHPSIKEVGQRMMMMGRLELKEANQISGASIIVDVTEWNTSSNRSAVVGVGIAPQKAAGDQSNELYPPRTLIY